MKRQHACPALFLVLVFALACDDSGTTEKIVYDTSGGIDGTVNITENATWHSGQTYVIQRPFIVKEGVTLTIEPGAVVSFNPFTIAYIDGTLNAAGTESRHIIVKNEGTLGMGCFRFTPTSTGNTVRYWDMRNTGITIDADDMVIAYCKITHELSSQAYMPITISAVSSGVTVQYCTLCGYGSGQGVDISTTGFVTLTHCIIRDFRCGLYYTAASGAVSLEYCSIIFNTQCGIINSCGTVTIHNSNISNNTTYNYNNYSNLDQDATSNWWGTTNSSEIDALINDHNDSVFYDGLVNYSSFRSAAVDVIGCGW